MIRQHRVPAPFGRWVLGRTDNAQPSEVVLVDEDGDRWTLTRAPSGDRWTLRDSDGAERTATTCEALIGLAERSGAKFLPWPTPPAG